MPSRHLALGLAAVAALGLATGCEKKSPLVTVTAHGTVVTAHAWRYCRGTECDDGKDIPVLEIHAGDYVGISVPRSLAEQGWRYEIGPQASDFVDDHYQRIAVGEGVAGSGGEEIPLRIRRDPQHGEGEWRFLLKLK